MPVAWLGVHILLLVQIWEQTMKLYIPAVTYSA